MAGTGTIVNIIAILIGGFIGLLSKNKINSALQDTLTKTMGLCTIFLGIAGCLEKMIVIKDGALSTQGSIMVIISFAIGSFIGQLLNLEDKIEEFGAWLKHKTHSDNDASFINGFVTASLTVCIGAMAIVGSIQDGIFHDPSTLFAKSLLDFIIVMILSASQGKGCMFSFIPVALVQGFFTILAKIIEPLLSAAALSNLSLTGSMLIFCVGVNLIWPHTFKVANMLPTIVIAALFALL